MPELGLGIGMEMSTHEELTQNWLYWYDRAGQRYPTPNNLITQTRQQLREERQRADQERQRADQERQRADQAARELEALREQLRSQGIDPDTL